MLALGIRYLTGYAVATDPASRDRAEWPPHPGRIFMALAAAHFETGEEPKDKLALEWLEAQPAPDVAASDAGARVVVTHYVPVNDKAGPARGILQSLPGVPRGKQPRTYPRVRPTDDTLWLVWQDAQPDDDVREALSSLCAKVTRVGHSSSLVQAWVAEDGAARGPTWIPDDDAAEIRLRVVSRGTLEYLRGRYNGDALAEFTRLDHAVLNSAGPAQKAAKQAFEEAFGTKWTRNAQPPQSLRPALGLWQGYRRAKATSSSSPAGSAFDPGVVVLRLEPTEQSFPGRLDLTSTLRLVDTLRRAVLSRAEELGLDSLPPVISGHEANGSPLERPHCAYVPLAFIGHEHAHGHLLGLGLVLPRAEHWPARASERRQVMAALARVQTLRLGGLGVWRLVPEVREAPPHNLLPATWTGAAGGAHAWGTVTPIAFDRHPKAGSKHEYYEQVANMIRQGCGRIGLPEPAAVQPGPVSPHAGVPASSEFPRLRRKDASERRHTHATIHFSEPVRGPVVVGAGRYRGYGFCRPTQAGGEE